MSTKENPLGATWFKISRWSDRIDEYTVTKSTSQTIWFRERNFDGTESARIVQARKGGDWYPSKAEALAEQRTRLERELQTASDRYSKAVKKLKDFNLKHAGQLAQPDAASDEQPKGEK